LATDRQRDKQTDEQIHTTDAISRSRCRKQRLTNEPKALYDCSRSFKVIETDTNQKFFILVNSNPGHIFLGHCFRYVATKTTKIAVFTKREARRASLGLIPGDCRTEFGMAQRAVIVPLHARAAAYLSAIYRLCYLSKISVACFTS